MSSYLQYVFCGDDFTGATDTLATLSRAGLRSRLFLSPAALLECRDVAELDAAGIATAARSMKPEEIKVELAQAGKALAALDTKVFHFKVCSTFDSSPQTGSIGAAVQTLKQVLPNAGVMIVGGQPSLRRYCVFSNLFAAAVDDKIYRIDTHPTMANHPVTPISESDLRILLSAQGIESIHGIHLPLYTGDTEKLHHKVCHLVSAGTAVLFDALQQSDISLIGKLIHDQQSPCLVIGSSSVAEAYIGGLPSRPPALTCHTPSKPEKPVFVLAGSRSQATATQVEEAKDFIQFTINPAAFEHDSNKTIKELSAMCIKLLKQGSNVLAIVSNDLRHSLSRVEVAQLTADLTARIAFSGLLGRLGIAGGDTSSFALQFLGIESISYVADIEPGICLCRLHSPKKPTIHGLEVVLKGGQMGTPDIFTKLTGLL
jgi:uncharacterized protein YgbK (DUF1537 family)